MRNSNDTKGLSVMIENRKGEIIEVVDQVTNHIVKLHPKLTHLTA